MKSLLHIGAALLTLTVATNVQAGVYNDSYIGGIYGGNPDDVVGNPAVFDITSIEFIQPNANSLTVRVHTGFVDPASGNRLGAELGDLFLGTGYTSDTPTQDDYLGSPNNYRFDYGIQLLADGSIAAWGINNGTEASYAAAVESSDDYFSSGYRRTQEVRVDSANAANNGNIIIGGVTGSWSENIDPDYLEINIDGIDLLQLPGDFSYHWAMTCANDVIEGQVPEPTSLLVFSAFAGFGFIGSSRRRRRV